VASIEYWCFSANRHFQQSTINNTGFNSNLGYASLLLRLWWPIQLLFFKILLAIGVRDFVI
jgi:hypothetical protein